MIEFRPATLAATHPAPALPRSTAELPAQRAGAPQSTVQARALYFNTGNAFGLQS